MLAGHSPDVLRTAKILFRMGARHISIANTEKSISEMLAAELEQWEKRFSSGISKRVFFPIDTNHFLYSLSSSDGIVIFDENFDPIMSNNFEYHMKEIRPYKKRQLMIILSDSLPESRQEENTALTIFTSENLFSSQRHLQEEIESARKIFEETTELEAENIFSWYQSVVDDPLSKDSSLLEKRDTAVLQ